MPRGARTAAVALVGAALGIWVWQGMHQPAAPVARPHPSSPPVSSLLQAEDICTALVGETLEVSFRLTNVGQQPVTVVGVSPDLPMGMLMQLPTTHDNGHCGSGPPAAAGATLAPGASTPETFHLLPMVDCPQPAPVAASVEVARSSPATVSVPVLVDLGSVDFPGCATATPAAAPA